MISPRIIAAVLSGSLLLAEGAAQAQIDTIPRSLLQLGYDQAIDGDGPQAVYAYYYYNNPTLINTNIGLRVAAAPLYLDGELGFRELISPTTDFGLGLYGGGLGDNYYDVNQGNYLKDQSFNGSGGGLSASIYQHLNPGSRIPLQLVARGGFRYTFYTDRRETADDFTLPENRATLFTRTGLRLAGKEPLLYPDLAMELSIWYERQWRTGTDPFGFNGDREVSPNAGLYWVHAGLNYAWTNIGHQMSFAVTAGGSSDTDQFSAWRLGGVLPLVAEFPLMLPGYYYQELSATRFVHLYGSYSIPLEPSHRFQLRLEAATARLDFLPGYEQPSHWQTGVGAGLAFTPKSERCRLILRYGYGFNALRDGEPGAQSVGVLFQYDFKRRKQTRE